jgi:hypothetical protein
LDQIFLFIDLKKTLKMQATTAPSTTTLPSIKFLLESSVEMFNGGK